MNMDFRASIREALGLTRAKRLTEATEKIQNALSVLRNQPTAVPKVSIIPHNSAKVTRPLADVVSALQQIKRSQLNLGKPAHLKTLVEPELVEGAEFLTRSFSCPAGTRSYKLYLPSRQTGMKRPLLLMLHGCTQDPSDFAAGTRMNALAENHGMLVAYPAQSKSANASACWNWFNPQHQHQGIGEPSIIAGITAQIIKSYDIDTSKVFIAGLSAGGAMAIVMGATYTEMFAGIGVHSGLPYQSATDVVSAFAAMRGESRQNNVTPKIRTIVFHGDADGTVCPSNATKITNELHLTAHYTEQGVSNGGRKYTRHITQDHKGVPIIESWLVHGAGHAWFGGSASGSYTDANGPNASAEMLRFFLTEKA